MNEPALAVLLLLLGGITARICLTGDYLRYVKPGLLPFLAAAAVMLIAIGSMTLWYHFRTPRARGAHRQTNDEPAHDPQEVHAHEPGVSWLLLVPVLALALLAPPALGADAATRAGTALTEPTGDFPRLPEENPAPLSLRDYASRAAFDEGRSIGDRQVLLTGFVTLGANGEVFLTVLIMSCCAADARPIKVGLSGDVPGDLQANSWLQVVGTYTPHQIIDEINSGIIPFVQVTSVTRVDEPDDPYTY
jgi:uncharacterized repeat protein (TIGR03943 family)